MAVSIEKFVFFEHCGDDIREGYEKIQYLGTRKQLCGCELEELRGLICYVEARLHPVADEIPILNSQNRGMLILPKTFVDVYYSGRELFAEDVFKSRIVNGGEIEWVEDDPIDIYSAVRDHKRMSQRGCAAVGSRAARFYTEKYLGC